MSERHDEMAKLGFTPLSGFRYVHSRSKITIHFGRGNKRPWYAMKGGKTLCAHGDMLDSGPMRKFETPMAAAKAALERWT